MLVILRYLTICTICYPSIVYDLCKDFNVNFTVFMKLAKNILSGDSMSGFDMFLSISMF